MTLALLTFVVTLTTVLGSYWAFVLRPETQISGRLRQRIQVKVDRPVGASVVKSGATDEVAQGIIGILVNWHRRYTVAAAGRLIESAGMRTDPAWLVGGTAIALTLVVIVLQAAHAGWPIALAAGTITPLVPYFYIRRAARARLNAFEEIFPDAISLMARALRAGHALTSTLAMVADEIPEPVKSEFRALYEQHNYGLPLPQVLRTFAARIPLMDVRFFATAVLTQRETGGNLAEVLDNLGTVTRDRFRVRRQLRVLTAQGRMTGWILAGLPICLALVLYWVNPGQMAAFLRDPVGVRLMEGAIVLQVVGMILIRKIVTVEY
ncbi:MAG TPA: type II secretion system F family protein [Vicinamibacterales bacterium]|jgi:tight adherence protein B